jgi:ComF family protein
VNVARTTALGRLAALGAGFVDLVLPRHCVACESALGAGEAGVVCGLCWASLVRLPHPQCERCGHPKRLSGPPRVVELAALGCRWCANLPPTVRAARSVCWMPGGGAAAIVRALKYDGWSAAADGMAERMARLTWPPDVLAERAALVPVPLSATRLRERGYNQSALLARALAGRWALPVWEDVLQRARATQSQTRLTPGDRLRNVAGAFLACTGSRERLRGAHVMLVDDVVTTAATLNACAAALVDGGVRIISYVTFARAPAAGDLR